MQLKSFTLNIQQCYETLNVTSTIYLWVYFFNWIFFYRSGYPLKDTVNFAEHIETMMRKTLGVDVDEAIEEEEEITDEEPPEDDDDEEEEEEDDEEEAEDDAPVDEQPKDEL